VTCLFRRRQAHLLKALQLAFGPFGFGRGIGDVELGHFRAGHAAVLVMSKLTGLRTGGAVAALEPEKLKWCNSARSRRGTAVLTGGVQYGSPPSAGPRTSRGDHVLDFPAVVSVTCSAVSAPGWVVYCAEGFRPTRSKLTAACPPGCVAEENLGNGRAPSCPG